MNFKSLFLFPLLLLTISLLGQEKLKYSSSGSSIQLGILFHNIGSYSAAIEQYQSVSENDTNYVLAQYELSLSYIKDGKPTEALEVIESAMELGKTKYDRSFINNKGSALREMGQIQEAIKTYTEGIKRFPNSTVLYYGRGLVYEEQKSYQKAFEDFKTTVSISPYYAVAHYKMGALLERAQRPVEGMLSLLQAATINSYDQLSTLSLDLAENIVIGKVPDNIIVLKTDAPEELMKRLEQKMKEGLSGENSNLINSKIDNKLLRSIAKLFQSLEMDKDNDNFWYSSYINFFGKIIPDGQFDAYSNYLMSNYSDSKVSNQAKKQNIESFKVWGKEELDLLLVREMEWDGKVQPVRFWVSTNNEISAIGNVDDNQEERVGYWEFYFNNGVLNSKGVFSEKGKRQGEWVWFDELGNKTEQGNYIDGQAEGAYQLFHPNGKLKRMMEYKADTLNGKYEAYSQFGNLIETTQFKKGKKEDTTQLYFNQGPLQYVIPYKGDEVNGTVKKYFISGDLDEEFEMKDNERNGAYYSYYSDGDLYSKGTYKDGLQEGAFAYYYKNGQLSAERRFKEGNQVGRYKNYYQDGRIEEEGTLDENGKLNAILTRYDRNGIKNNENEYRNGDFIGYVNYDENGEVKSKARSKRGKLKTVSYHFNGAKSSEGTYKAGNKIGKWKFYYPNGELSSEEAFKKDQIIGEDFNYHKNGELESKVNYAEGARDGYYETHYIDGQLKEQGFYQKDVIGGPSEVYYSNGTISRKTYYIGGEINGCDVYYDEKGRISDKYCYDKGVLEEYFSYDTAANVLNYIVLKGGSAEFQLKHINGNKSAKVAYKHGDLHGTFEWYDGLNQLDTKGQYEFGNKVGTWEYFNENGKQSASGNYLLNDKQGTWKWFFEDGSIETLGDYTLGKKTGKWVDYHENGNMNMEENYIEGELHGPTIYYDEAGEIQIQMNYYEGTLDSYSYLNSEGVLLPEIPLKHESGKVLAYYKNGNKSIEYELEKGLREGELKIYHSNGNLLRTLIFKNDLLEGKAVYNTIKGSKRKEVIYTKGNKNGIMTTYYPTGEVETTKNYLLGDLYGKSVWYAKTCEKEKERMYYDDKIISETKF